MGLSLVDARALSSRGTVGAVASVGGTIGAIGGVGEVLEGRLGVGLDDLGTLGPVRGADLAVLVLGKGGMNMSRGERE